MPIVVRLRWRAKSGRAPPSISVSLLTPPAPGQGADSSPPVWSQRGAGPTLDLSAVTAGRFLRSWGLGTHLKICHDAVLRQSASRFDDGNFIDRSPGQHEELSSPRLLSPEWES